MLKSPYGWSSRYAAAQDRKANQELNAAKNTLRHAHIRKATLNTKLADKEITQDEYDVAIVIVDQDIAAATNALSAQEKADPSIAPSKEARKPTAFAKPVVEAPKGDDQPAPNAEDKAVEKETKIRSEPKEADPFVNLRTKKKVDAKPAAE